MNLLDSKLDEQACGKCGVIVHGRTVRFRCPACGGENRPSRKTLPGGRARTESMREMTRQHRHLTIVTAPDERRPRTRGECKGAPRPCPWVSCRHHLALEVTRTGGLKEKFPGVELEDMPHTCSLDLADSGPMALDSVAYTLNVTAERVRQIEESALENLKPLVNREDIF